MKDKILAFFVLVISVPLWLFLYITVKLTSPGPFIFKQKRMGKNKKIFTLYKIRAMVDGAELLKKNYQHLNEVDGPVFKIRNDPRYTKIGKFLSHTALDELPQLINVIRGEMAFVGPRPLPTSEAKKIPKIYQTRFSILPGITSTWILKGAHQLSFEEWMREDLDYVRRKSSLYDILILLNTFLLIPRLIISEFKDDTKQD